MPTAAIYIRVSTTEQAEKGYSLDTQREACRQKAADLGYTVAAEDEYTDDGYSGAYLDRPALDRLRGAIRAGRYKGGAVIVLDPDRLARNLAHQLIITEEIEKGGARLLFVSVTFEQSPEGKLFYSIRGAIADYEKEKIRERSMRGKRGKARKGKVVYNDRPLGYDWDAAAQNYTVNDAEAAIIRRIFDLYTQKYLGLRAIANALNVQGYRTKKGFPFYMAAIQRIISNPMYKGTKLAFRYLDKPVGQKKYKRYLRDPGECIEIPVPPIIAAGQWEKAQKVLAENATFADRNAREVYMLSGIARCACCGRAIIGMNYRRHGRKYRYYICSAKFKDAGSCPSRYIPMEILDREVWADLTTAVQAGVNPAKQIIADEGEEGQRRLEASIAKLIRRQALLMKWVREGTVDDLAGADKEMQALKKELDTAQAALKAVPPEKPRPGSRPAEMPCAATPGQKRRLLRTGDIKVYARRSPAGEIEWLWQYQRSR